MAEEHEDTGSNGDSVGDGGINLTRRLVEFWYDGSSHEADIPVTATAVNSETGDVGTKKDKNDGLVSFSYPPGTDVIDRIYVNSDEDGSLIAEFLVRVRIAK